MRRASWHLERKLRALASLAVSLRPRTQVWKTGCRFLCRRFEVPGRGEDANILRPRSRTCLGIGASDLEVGEVGPLSLTPV